LISNTLSRIDFKKSIKLEFILFFFYHFRDIPKVIKKIKDLLTRKTFDYLNDCIKIKNENFLFMCIFFFDYIEKSVETTIVYPILIARKTPFDNDGSSDLSQYMISNGFIKIC
jgi:hypothetical protein